jgi:predicted DCC family thiol-disulfide oxidoreductase YuxK
VAERLSSPQVAGTLLFDGDCGFCTTAAGMAARIAPAVTVVPWQRADLVALGVRAEAAEAALQWVALDGKVYAGAAAAARLLVSAGRAWKLLGWLLLLPVVRTIAELVYRLVAANRHRLPGGTPACRAD